MKCALCNKKTGKTILIEPGKTPEEQTGNHLHICIKCAKLIKEQIERQLGA